MKAIKYLFSLCLIVMSITACSDEEKKASFIFSAVAPSDVVMQFQVTQDNSGLVTITPNATGAISFDITYGDDSTESVSLENGQHTQHTYAEGTYTVTCVAYGPTGLETTVTQELVVSFQAPTNVEYTIENDSATSKQVNVTVSADFAVSFDVYSEGLIASQVPPISANIGDTAVLNYTDAGFYTITIEVMGAAIETTTIVVEDFEVTEILAPINTAPNPPTRDAADVVSIFSDAYDDVTLDELPTSWGVVDFEATTVESDNVWKLTSLDFLGIVTNYANGVDLSLMETMHIDYWVPEGATNELLVKIVNTIDGGEDVESLGTTVGGSWQSIDIPMTGFDGGDLANTEKITQLLIDSDGVSPVVYIDNFYFYRQGAGPAFDDGLLNNGDFQNGSEYWLTGVSDDSTVPVVTEANGNIHFSTDVANAGNPWDVNMSQKVEIIQDAEYTLSFEAWSDTDRTILAGIGLSAGPWTNVTEEVSISTSRTTYTYNFVATGFGAPDARVLFDMGAAVGQVNIDHVSLNLAAFDSGLLQNGDFENGSEYWLTGVADDSSVPVVTGADGNNYFSVDVPNAGNPWDVNMSQKLEITEDSTYTLTFDAWSDVDRPMLAGIGLSAGPWTNVTEEVNLTTTSQTFSVTLTATGFGAPDARVLFDMGAAAGQVNIDNVSLTLN